MKHILTISLILLVSAFLFGQNESVIHSIRDRYYRINGEAVKLEKVTIEDTDYYFENKKLSIAKKESNEGRYEYYYDFMKDKYQPYFIYFEPKNNELPQLRAYYDDNANLVLLKENSKEYAPISFDNYYPHKFLKQDSYNALNVYFNHFTLSQNPNSGIVNTIFKEVKKITESIVKTDTIEYKVVEDGTSGKLKFLDENGNTVKVKSFFGGEHGSFNDIKYYSNGQLIYSTGESAGWVGSYTSIGATIKFYQKDKLFRIEEFDRESTGKAFNRSNNNYFLDWPSEQLENCIPLITYPKEK